MIARRRKTMAQILIRGLDDEVVKFFKEQAAKNGRSLQKHIVQTLSDLVEVKRRHEDAVKAMDELRARQLKRRKGKPFPSSVDLIRRDRESH
jgi:plasmid stability protein